MSETQQDNENTSLNLRREVKEGLEDLFGVKLSQNDVNRFLNDGHELDKQIERAERKIGQKLLDRFVNSEDMGARVVTPKVKHLHEVKHADSVNEELRKEYSDAHAAVDNTLEKVQDERQSLNQVRNERWATLDNEPTEFEDLNDAHDTLSREVDEAVSRESDAVSAAKEFYEVNKDKLHEAALYDAKTAGVDTKTPGKS